MSINCPGVTLGGVSCVLSNLIIEGAQQGVGGHPAVRVIRGAVHGVTLNNPSFDGPVGDRGLDDLPAGEYVARTASGWTMVGAAPPAGKAMQAALLGDARHALLIGQSDERNGRWAVDHDGSMHWGGGTDDDSFDATLATRKTTALQWPALILAGGAAHGDKVSISGVQSASMCQCSHDNLGEALVQLSCHVSKNGTVQLVLRNADSESVSIAAGEVLVVISRFLAPLKTDDTETAAAPVGLTLTPLWLPELILTPNVAGVIDFNLSGTGAHPAQLTFNGQDYRHTVPDGGWPVIVPVSSNGTASLTLTHSIGYYEYRCEETNQTFGVIATPELPKPLDERFAVVAGFTQICNTAPVPLREPLLAMLARIGVRHYRDFPQQGQLRPNASGTYDWDHVDPSGLAGRMEQLHAIDKKYDLRVLDCFGGALPWNQRSDWFDGKGAAWRWPKNLSVTADTFEAIASHWGDTQVRSHAHAICRRLLIHLEVYSYR